MQLWVKDGWSAPWRNQWMTRDAGEGHDILRKASPRLEETDGGFKTQGLPAQPQVIMGSGLVGQRGDSGQAVLADVDER